MLMFGSGYATLVPPSGAADITPVRVAKLQEVSVDLDQTVVEARSNQKFADDAAVSEAKISGKIKALELNSRAYKSILAGSTSTTGQLEPAMDVPTGVIASAQFDTGIVLANFDTDLGVLDDTGLPMQKVTSAAAAGQYQCDTTTGPNVLYKFNAGANGKTYKVSYVKKNTTAGTTISLSNQLMGTAVKYQLILQNQYTPQSAVKTLTLRLYAVVIPKISLAMKNTAHTTQDLDFTAQADPSTSKVLDLSLTE